MFRGWSAAWPGVEVLAAQLPGREHRVQEVPCRDLDRLVADLAAAVRALPGPVPLAIFGHSLGALIGFLLARELLAAGAAVRWLFAAAARAPHRPPRRILHDLPLPALLAEMLRLGGTPPRLLAEREFVELIEPMLRADLWLAEANVVAPSPPLPVPIAVFGGREDSHTAAADLEAWREVAGAGCSVEFLPGGHFFVRDAKEELWSRMAGVL
jgi:medium-chain acyl-[acyl-carrier-protein] hydrolase